MAGRLGPALPEGRSRNRGRGQPFQAPFGIAVRGQDVYFTSWGNGGATSGAVHRAR
jgi:hypothetical protein